jgi:hypothetical protein
MESIVEEDVVQLEEEPKETFSGWFECDSCRVARAMWKITGNSGEIYLCGHHKNRSEAALTKWAIKFIELDEKLT